MVQVKNHHKVGHHTLGADGFRNVLSSGSS